MARTVSVIRRDTEYSDGVLRRGSPRTTSDRWPWAIRGDVRWHQRSVTFVHVLNFTFSFSINEVTIASTPCHDCTAHIHTAQKVIAILTLLNISALPAEQNIRSSTNSPQKENLPCFAFRFPRLSSISLTPPCLSVEWVRRSITLPCLRQKLSSFAKFRVNNFQLYLLCNKIAFLSSLNREHFSFYWHIITM